MPMWNADGSLRAAPRERPSSARNSGNILQWDIPERVERPRQERQVPSFPDTRGLPSAGCRTKEPTWIEKKGKTDAAFKAQAGNNIFEPEQASPKRPHSAYKQRDFDGHNIFSMDHVGKESPVRPRGIPGVSPEKLALYSGAEARGVMLHTDGSPVRGISDAKKRDIAGSGLFQAQGPQDLFQVRERPVSEAKMKDFVGSDIFNQKSADVGYGGRARIQHEGRVKDYRGHGLFGTEPGTIAEEKPTRRGMGMPRMPSEVARFEAEMMAPRQRPPSGRMPPGGGRTNIQLG